MEPVEGMGSDLNELPWNEIRKYLGHFGYLSSEAASASMAATPEASLAPPVEALRRFQEFFQVGGASEAERMRLTLETARLPRCGFRDLRDGQNKPLGCAWGLKKRVLVYEVENEPEGVAPGQAINAIEIAIILWNDVLSRTGIPLVLKKRMDEKAVDISFAWRVEETEVPFIGTPVARADFPPKCGVLSNTLPRPVVFNAAKPWVADSSNVERFNIRAVAAHEIGHILGLPHSEDQGSVMFPALFRREEPALGDQQVLERLYHEHLKRATPFPLESVLP